MKSVDFPQANVAIAKDQPQYQTLYAHFDVNVPHTPATSCFELTDEEIKYIVDNRKLWFTQCTYGKAYSPIYMSVVPPFEEVKANTQPLDENRVSAEVWDKVHYTAIEGDQLEHGPCIRCGKRKSDHFWSTRQCTIDII